MPKSGVGVREISDNIDISSTLSTAVERVHGVSVDVEDYRRILRGRYRGESGPVSATFERDMEAVCELFAIAGVQATFFVLGDLALQRGDLLRQWASLGHELASHGWDHRPIWKMTPVQFRRDLLQAKAAIEDAAGQPVAGYRAPIFSVRWDTLWAVDAIAECGLSYDSSIVPARLRRYGVAGFERAPQAYTLPSGRQIVEIPITVTKMAGVTVPMSGGGYFRLFSWRRVYSVAAAANKGTVPPFVMYFHPDELSNQPFRTVDLARTWPDQLKAMLLAWKSNLGRKKVPSIIRRLLAEFRFTTIGKLAKAVRATKSPVLWPSRYDLREPLEQSG